MIVMMIVMIVDVILHDIMNIMNMNLNDQYHVVFEMR